MQLFRRFLLLACAGLVVPACTSDDDSAGPSSVLIASATVDAAGGIVSVTDVASPLYGTKVVIPAGALAASTPITIHRVLAGSPYAGNVLDYEFGPTGTTFTAPVTVTISYLPQYLTDIGLVDPTLLRVVETSPATGSEALITTSQDAVNHTISVQSSHFSSFAALGYTDGTLAGNYTMIQYHYDTGYTQPNAVTPGGPQPRPLGFLSKVANLSYNGAGAVNLTSETWNLDGTPSAGSPDSGTYAVASDGEYTMTAGNPFSGQVRAGGAAFTFASLSGLPQISVAVKKGSGFSTASLSGAYTMVQYHYDTGATQPNAVAAGNPQPCPLGFICKVATLTYDGAGAVALTGEVFNQDGTPGAGPDDAGTYSVAANGAYSMSAGSTFSGQVIDGGSMLIFASSTGLPQISFAFKKGTGLGTASLNGAYTMLQYHYDTAPIQPNEVAIGSPMPRPLGFICKKAILTYNGGAGTVALTGEVTNLDGVAGVGANDAGTYSVAADGAYSMTAGNTFAGQILADGSAVIFVSLGQLPQISIAVRK